MEQQLSNNTFSFNLQMARFDIPLQAIYPVFIIGALIYFFAVFCNVTILALIVTQQSLHKPMYYILFSLPLTDLMGITCALPKVLLDIVTQTNAISYPACILQGFLLHLYGGSVLFILAAMSFDRYIAICKPLRYNSIMGPYTVGGVIALAWGLDIALILVLFSLQARVPKCKTFIFNVYCSNNTLLQLSCGGDLTVNNLYGLAITGIVQGISVTIQLFSYVQILKACLSHTQTDARSKAVNTCLAQLIIFFLYEIVTTFTVLSYRFQNIPLNAQQICGMLIFTILPVFNPIIYGMKTRDIRNSFIIVLKRQRMTFK
ncbi:putative gustatory receptor clone PTE03 [Hemibagrus wyckioides]|uniref:putative gustatory receptor clone PTE03 n=1 Tax=Hemibagrus wyckioides TaxID=337641 RepID=UPI00266BF63E|nr:putative gustatory receptor clone PTE03 [Hemibagrus wyckioides]